jgi:hypothetical protein
MNKEQLFVKMALSAWETHIGRASELLNSLSDEQLLNEIAPNRNSGIYLIGHLIAIHDAMNDILGLGKRSHLELDEAFVQNPDHSGFDMPAVSVLKKYWNDVHQKLGDALKQLSPDEWFKRHTHMTEEDFAKEPHRNKLNVLINRTNHLAYHLGQLRLLKSN